jgi:hypothetical protein
MLDAGFGDGGAPGFGSEPDDRRRADNRADRVRVWLPRTGVDDADLPVRML